MMDIMVFRTRPEGQEMMQAPGKFIATMSVDCLAQSTDDPDVHGQYVEISGHGTQQDRRSDGAESKYHDFNG